MKQHVSRVGVAVEACGSANNWVQAAGTCYRLRSSVFVVTESDFMLFQELLTIVVEQGPQFEEVEYGHALRLIARSQQKFDEQKLQERLMKLREILNELLWFRRMVQRDMVEPWDCLCRSQGHLGQPIS